MEEQYYEVYAYTSGSSDIIECDNLEEAYREAERLSKLWGCDIVITKVEKQSFIYRRK